MKELSTQLDVCLALVLLQVPTLAAAAYLRMAGRPPVLPSNQLSYAENFLYMLDSLYGPCSFLLITYLAVHFSGYEAVLGGFMACYLVVALVFTKEYFFLFFERNFYFWVSQCRY